MRRHALGLIAIAFLFAAGVQTCQTGWPEVQDNVAMGICLRVGLVLGSAWLAYPQLRQIGKRCPPWLVAALTLSLMLLLVQPKAFRFLLPVVLLLIALQYVGRFFRRSRQP
jgi:hypothetical protein